MDVTSQKSLVSPAVAGTVLMAQGWDCCVSLYDVWPSALRIDSLEAFVNAGLWQLKSGQVSEMFKHRLQLQSVRISVYPTGCDTHSSQATLSLNMPFVA
jgi:hypothetical protein